MKLSSNPTRASRSAESCSVEVGCADAKCSQSVPLLPPLSSETAALSESEQNVEHEAPESLNAFDDSIR